ncbi:hypothetical protein N7471_004396 [Penicillium samsonianum]|uniref:uncharacterized protein n=1 Tax=Penicillium samsonianum TaxID=1882272 RepID=UPI0025490B28|nr:uncharacterized protein N7471_004396 [Penicillium samsonianum]KAJ6137910.1 hypothetical protein N7471_004396 [Penicillium samsonianum]
MGFSGNLQKLGYARPWRRKIELRWSIVYRNDENFDESPCYRVRVMRRAEVVLEFEMHFERQPTDDDVVTQLKSQA